MADKKKEAKTEAKPEQASEPKKGMPLKTILVVVAALLLEAGAIAGAFLLTGGPSQVNADPAAQDAAAFAEQPVEELVIEDKFQNTRTGRTYLYDTQIYIVIKRRNQDQTRAILKEKTAQISADITTIFRRAEPAHLLEPSLATLTRQIKASLDNRIGRDAETGESIVQEVLITKCTQFRADL
jgi:flagellar basal body-associated protein FliL